MSTLSIMCNGARYAVKVMPMMPLSAVVEDACRQAGIQCQLSSCTLKLGKQQVDLSIPFRFANIPSGAKLELHVAGMALGFRDAAQPTPAPAADASRDQNQPGPLSPTAGQPHSTASLPTCEMSSQANSSKAPAVASSQWEAAPMSAGASSLTDIESSVGRPFYLFSQDELADVSESRNGEESEEFYEMSPGDYFVLMAGAKAKASKDGMLMTQAMREAEATKKAQKLGAVRIRIVLPERLILQASFRATDKLSDLMEFVKRCLDPAATGWYLYSTPPKQVMEDTKPTLYQAGLVPAAKLYLGMHAASDKSLLRPEVLAHRTFPPTAEPELSADKKEKAPEADISAVAADSSQGRTGGSANANGKKVPKWLKMSK
eukprot:CAMPEP_0117649282 /NCGR_PEP_ID=MMETSP0804-20121206/883_1 /TAXON_ID=1074897 /ORGANISM="Tetraselmis astigmatica, Strain CCMP880" /LENGTH=374 /DNA_ID=CAMNT_0005454997 /DNA_START=248 /DNA_END=1372 /DNA_ORIENTATION=-